MEHSVPHVEERHLILSTRNYSEEKEATKFMNYVVRYLLSMSGSKICALTSAQIERHSVTNGCPVALTGAIAESTGKWSKQFNEMRNVQGTKPKSILIRFNHYHRQRPAPTILYSARDFQTQLGLALDPTKE